MTLRHTLKTDTKTKTTSLEPSERVNEKTEFRESRELGAGECDRSKGNKYRPQVPFLIFDIIIENRDIWRALHEGEYIKSQYRYDWNGKEEI